VLGVRRWREMVTGNKGRRLFDRPEPTAGCSANERRIDYSNMFRLLSAFILREYCQTRDVNWSNCIVTLTTLNSKVIIIK
jgi:hypothetical protein